MYEQSHRDYLRSDLSASSSACHGVQSLPLITPLPTKPSATAQRTEAGERGNYWHADASAWCCCARYKIHEELADAKAENDALRDDVAAGRRRLHIKQSVSQCVKPPPPPAWIMQPPRLADTAERDYFTLKLITMQKPSGRSRHINETSADRVAHIDGQLI